ncbi:MAG: hypothetical protein COU31_00395 [Candidatus Magasanikbacteria bacterium CG10_big_fil_rev_8_21_14_0_10_40_10]|uniref:Uncharacterized protein n=1 Tax=Candidatus Magasanikbacteria bacterium CG10_big_fil_rev_8_21_14_0_10_40_10 TaxID=1974648 RepID=A0A2M6W5C3_9BACT|nr:MAG: hypothetical protein COU31_00395 [Candidatus Magasanikbacteria bacterium CG10_big_fil_rev_8_21_14_0_10_40_10]
MELIFGENFEEEKNIKISVKENRDFLFAKFCLYMDFIFCLRLFNRSCFIIILIIINKAKFYEIKNNYYESFITGRRLSRFGRVLFMVFRQTSAN